MFSQTIEYALRAATHLASLPAGSAVNSESIAHRTRVPKGYLSKILRDLVLAGIVDSQRGPNGGFTLARIPAAISVLDVINAVDPIKRIHACPLGNPTHLTLCPLHHRIDAAIERMEQEFGATTLAQIVETNVVSGTPCRTLIGCSAKSPSETNGHGGSPGLHTGDIKARDSA